MLVSAGTSSNIYCDVLKMKNNPDLLRNRMMKSKIREKMPSGELDIPLKNEDIPLFSYAIRFGSVRIQKLWYSVFFPLRSTTDS